MDCDLNFGRFLLIQNSFYGFLAFRHFCVILLLFLTKNPFRVRDCANLVFLIIDAVFVTFLTVYGTRALFSPIGLWCRDNINSYTFRWWILSVCCLVFNWVYDLLLLIGLTSLPLIMIFWCFYQKQMSAI